MDMWAAFCMGIDGLPGMRKMFGGGGRRGEVCFALVLTTVLEPYCHNFGLPVQRWNK